MLYCDEYDKYCSEVTSEECDNGCCDSCMYCVVCTDEEWNEDLLWKRGFYMRGILTDSIQEKAVTFLNRTISQKELRLYPYIDYSIKNACQGWSYSKMDEEEIEILNRLYDERHIIYSPEKIIVTRNFYNYMQDVLAMGYVEEFI